MSTPKKFSSTAQHYAGTVEQSPLVNDPSVSQIVHNLNLEGGDHDDGSQFQMNWDESAAEVLINGRRIDDCPREIIRRTGMDEASFKRAAFIYTQAMRNVPYETIGTEILTTDPNWKAITSVSGVRAAALRFAKKFGLPRPPLRHYYRRSGERADGTAGAHNR